MNTELNKKKMPVSLAIILIVMVALAGAIAFYLQYQQNQKFIAASEQALMEQKNQALAVFDQIEANLARIREHESMIQQDFSGPENNSDLAPEIRIQNEINFIEHLLDENNKLIASLNDQVKQRDTRISAYEHTVKELKTRVSEYQNQLDLLVAEKEALRQDLDRSYSENNQLATRVGQMGEEIVQKENIIESQKQQLLEKEDAFNTAYYAVGTYKTLRDRNVLQKEGGFLGINRVTMLVDDPDTGQFQKIDTREVTMIPIFAKRFDIVSRRDRTSYEVDYGNEQAEWLSIKDPEKFWKNSRYLVIVVREDDYNELAESR